MAQQQQPNHNPKSPGIDKNFEGADIGANNPVKKEGNEKRDSRQNADKANQNLGSQKYRDSNVNTARSDQTAR